MIYKMAFYTDRDAILADNNGNPIQAMPKTPKSDQ